MNQTRRQKLAGLLREGPRTARELSRVLGAPVKAVLNDLEHVRRGLKAGEEWAVEEPECLRCGFVFRERKRLDRPSRCPECRSEDLREPAYAIARQAGADREGP